MASDSFAQTRALLRHRPYLLFFGGRGFSKFAAQIGVVAIGWQVYELTDSAFYLGMIGLAQFAPMAILVFLAGHVADRYERKRVAQICQMVQSLPAAYLAWGAFNGSLSVVELFAAVAVEGGLVFGTFPFIAPLLITRGIGSTMEAGFAIGAFGLGGLVFAALVAPLLARFGQAGVIRIGGATAAAALIGFALAPSLLIAALSGLGLGLGFYMIHNAIQTRATELAPQARASAMSLHAFAFFGGQSLGPIFYGMGDMTFGLPATLGLAAAGIMVLALLLARR